MGKGGGKKKAGKRERGGGERRNYKLGGKAADRSESQNPALAGPEGGGSRGKARHSDI